MPFVWDLDGLDRVTFKKGPGSVHDRVLKIAYEATPPEELPEEPLSVFSRWGTDFADGSLESLDFLLRLEQEFGPFEEKPGQLKWWERVGLGGTSPAFNRELQDFWLDLYRAEQFRSDALVGHFILFFESREQG